MKGFRALDDILVIERDAAETMSAGGLIIPTVAQEELDQGTVVATGEGKMNDDGKILPMKVFVGDKVLFSKYANLAFKLHGKEYITMHPADIIGIIDPLKE